MAKLSRNTPLEMRFAARARDAVEPTCTAVGPPMGPVVPTVYGPRQRRYRAPLNSRIHFGTAAQLQARNDILDRQKLTPELLAVQRQWSAVSTAALYAKNARQLKSLRSDVEAMLGLVAAVLGAFGKQIAAMEKANGKQKAKREAHQADARAAAPDKGAPEKGAAGQKARRGGNAPASRDKVRH